MPDKNGAEPKEKDSSEEPAREITLSNGIRLELKPVPPFLVRKAALGISRPVPPSVSVNDKGRTEPNPNDPDYQKALAEYEEKTSDMGNRVMMIVGTEILEPLPEGIQPPESNEWVELLRILEIEVPEGELGEPRQRKYAWLRYYALATAGDVIKVIGGLTRLSGIPEKEVDEAVRSFRGGEGRGAARSTAGKDA